jgi:hypothetical protein
MTLFGVSLAIVFAFSSAYATMQYSRMVADRTPNALGWLIAMLVVGPFAIPYFHWRLRSTISGGVNREWLANPAGWVPLACIVAFFMDFGYTMSLLGQKFETFPPSYFVVSTISSILVWSTWVICIFFVWKTSDPLPRKLAWSVGIVVLPFVLGPIHYFAYGRPSRPT